MHSTKFILYLCNGYLLVMYSILKKMIRLKLALILVIFSIAGIYVSEIAGPVPQEAADFTPVRDIYSPGNYESPESDRADHPGTCSLGDLRLYIEL